MGIFNKVRGAMRPNERTIVSKDKKRSLDVKAVHTDKFGNVWYMSKDIESFPAERYLEVNIAMVAAQEGITAELSQEMDQLVIDKLISLSPRNPKEVTEAVQYVMGIMLNRMERRNMASTPDVMLELISVMTFINSEGVILTESNKQKKKKALRDDENSFFFLTDLYLKRMSKHMSTQPNTRAYYKEKAHVLKKDFKIQKQPTQ
jgi:hypothetical protein